MRIFSRVLLFFILISSLLVANSSEERQIRYSGQVIDKDGLYLNDVVVRVEKYKSDLQTLTDIKEKSLFNVNGQFEFIFTDCDGVRLTFIKEGFQYYKDSIQFSPIGNTLQEVTGRDIKLIANAEVPKDIKKIRFTYNNGAIKFYSKNIDEELKPKILLNLVSGNSLQITSNDNWKFHEIDNDKVKEIACSACEAPVTGYKSTIIIEKNNERFPDSYFFIRMLSGKYGKIKLNRIYASEDAITAFGYAYLKTEEGTNLSTFDF